MNILEQADAAETRPCTSVGQLIAALGKTAMRRFAAALEPAGIKPRHLNALLSLRAGETSQQGLAEAIKVDSVQLVGLLNDLESEGLVERRRDPADRRRHIVAISCKGEQRLVALDAAGDEVDDGLLAGLDPHERGVLHGLLLRIAANADGDTATPCPSETDGASPD